MTVKQHILDFLKGQDWVHKGKIEDQARGWGREVSNIDRRCRELVVAGKLERRLNSKGHAEYRAINYVIAGVDFELEQLDNLTIRQPALFDLPVSEKRKLLF